jgi:hypothetical protein
MYLPVVAMVSWKSLGTGSQKLTRREELGLLGRLLGLLVPGTMNSRGLRFIKVQGTATIKGAAAFQIFLRGPLPPCVHPVVVLIQVGPVVQVFLCQVK